MKRYEAYKDSGIEWIGEIPEHWEVVRMKYLTDIGNGRDHKGVWDNNGTYSILGSGGEFGRANVFLYNKPSVILGRKGTIDKPLYIHEPFWAVDTAYFTMSKEYTDTKFLFYLCKTINFDLYKYGSAVPSMNQEELKEIRFSVPSTEEQTAIANYLDRKTAEIDQLIADKKRLVELYQEEKKAIINQAVTKGINPDAPMKDSGIEWLGEIPEHWESTSLKWYANIYSGGTPSKKIPEYWTDGTIPWLNSGTVNQWDITEPSEYITEEALENSSAKWIPKESILMALAGQGKTKGMVAQVHLECTCNQSMAVIVPKENINKRFLLYCLHRNYQNIRNLGGGDKRDGINLEMIGSIPLPLISISEQKQIIDFIEEAILIINSKIDKANKYIELITEYRTALISEVVTGKIRVTAEDV